MRSTVMLLSLAVLAGCDVGHIFGPDLRFINRRPLEPVPDWYAAEYAAMEECVGRRGDFAAVRWFVADVVVLGGDRKGAGIELPHDITFDRDHWRNRYAVRHEAEHHIRQNGVHLPNGDTPCERAVPLR